MTIKKGIKVKVLTGKDKNKEGEVIEIDRRSNRAKIKGINLISGSCTPHSSDSKRINQFELNIKNNKLPPGIAIDDGVAVLFIDGKPSQVYSSRKNHDAYFIDKNKKISLKEYIKKNDY